ncbi:MAG: shikimate kinase [Kiritimatiellae bacterium]|nr:shikimate kinase [Kiritimatiellia bacterium]
MQRHEDDRNVVLIGMPGVGKSTAGVLLAKAMSRSFLDTDVHIQVLEGRRLQEIIDVQGMARFCRIEERHVLELDYRRCVVATGGSVVYSERAMAHLRRDGVTVHLDLPLALLAKHITDLDSRGIVMAPGQTLEGLYEERQPLYRRYADLTVDCRGKTPDQVVTEAVAQLRERQGVV